VADSIGVPVGLLSMLRAEAAGSRVDEVCGVLLGTRRGERLAIVDAVACANRHRQPARHFLVAAEDLRRADELARRRGLFVAGTYHSHPGGDARPSIGDRALFRAFPGVHLVLGRGTSVRAVVSRRPTALLA
jgi:proteasome lid subunit RPN8/RPN11